ncbi:selection and upkeep of intraepithelial T-cells protein 5-like isoform X2 [Betta splendens]|uniref:Selection and upkeep of intraepithelial T-cells protein 5-like isoform X2 n=1 Tax=Betta splendens TaxID=158456 RepID=A0A9W2Y607_BETSP|nr:selection and upkeep of intraepithelial T-cells protein 5-like isoform X2 [Betta splendens]
MAQTSALAEGVRGHELVTRPDVLTGTKSETCGRALVQPRLLHWLQVMGRSTGARVRTSALLVCLLLMGLSAAQSKLLVPSRPVVVPPGSDVTLPCGLDSAVDVTAETLEWTRPDLSPRFVLVWRSGQEFVNIKNPAFAGRTALFADELKTGNLSLKLSSVAVADEGTYKCFVPDKSEEAFVELIVAVAASPVVSLSGLDRDRGGVVLECRSGGWFPEPELLWLDAEGKLLSAGPTETVRGSDDLYTVSSRVTVDKRHSSRYTCRVQQTSSRQKTEAHIHVPDDFFNFPSASSAATVGLSITLAVCTVIFLLLFLLKIKNIINCQRHWRDGNDRERKTLMTNKMREEAEEREKTLRAQINAKKREVEQQQTELHQLQAEKKKKETNLLSLKQKEENVIKELQTIRAAKTHVFSKVFTKDEYNNKKRQKKAELEKLKEEVEIVENQLQDQINKVLIKQNEVISLLQDAIESNEILVGGQEINSTEIKNQTYNQLQEQQRKEEREAEKGVKTLEEKLETKNKEVEQKQTELQQLQEDIKNREKIVESVKTGLEKTKEPQQTEALLNDLEKKELLLQSTVKEFENKQTELRLLQEMIEIIKGSLQMMERQQSNNVRNGKQRREQPADNEEQAAEHKQANNVKTGSVLSHSSTQQADDLLNILEKKELVLQITTKEFENKQTELRLLQEMIAIIKGSLQMMERQQSNNVKTNKKQNEVKQDGKQRREQPADNEEQAAEHKQKDLNIITRHREDGGNTVNVTV